MTPRVSTFLAVGALGFVLQLSTLFLVTTVCDWPYAAATLVAVEAAVLHNFAWHERWTWHDRFPSRAGLARRLGRFHLGTGLTSLVGNLVVTTVAVELLHVSPLVANACAVGVTSVANFLVADRWVFGPPATASFAALLLLMPLDASAAELRPGTVAAWNRHVTALELTLSDHDEEPPVSEPEGRTLSVPGGTIHEWRGSVLLPGTTVGQLVQALQHPGLPPPAEDILEARVLSHTPASLCVYMKLTRSAVVTVTYDTEHDVTFAWRGPGFATSRSVATSIRESGGSDRGFLWRLNSYWRYRQRGNAVEVDVLSVSLSREIPAVVRPVASPIVHGIARESMRRTLDAVERFGRTLPPCRPACGAASAAMR
ncbi:MAG: GtrA family protein [Vicinamibacterales bacterium]